MRMVIALFVCAGIGYLAEVYFENPQNYVVWVGFTFITFGAYLYLTQVTSIAFALPVSITFVGAASTLGYIKDEAGFLFFGVYGAILALILLGDRFLSWRWTDWKSPAKLLEALTRHTGKQ